MDLYAPKRARVAAMIKRWSTGTVMLTRTTNAPADDATPWIPGAATLVVYRLDARADGVAGEYADGATVLATDLKVIASPKATLDGVTVDLVPRMTDVLTIDGAEKAIKKIDAVPASGPAAMFHIFVES